MSAGLTVPQSRGHTTPTFRQLAGISRTLNGVAGIGVLNPLGAMERRVQSRLSFAHRSSSIYDGLGGAPAMEAGSKWPVRQPRSVRPHVIGVARGRVINLHLESIMSNIDTPTGEIRPQTATSTTSTDTSRDFRWVREQTVIKRVRRKLAERGHSLLITREGTSGRRELGQYVVLGERHQVLSADCKLDSLARFLGVLDDGERIELPPFRGWKWYAGKHRVEVVDGIRFHYVDRLTRDYTSEQALAAAMAKAGITDAAVVSYRPGRVSFDGPISGQEGSHDAL